MSAFKVVIPARMQSTRLPKKPLAMINGKTMIERVVAQARSSMAEEVVVATDHPEIKSVVESFGGLAVLTSPDHQSGTDRLYETVQIMNWADETVIVNVQGDEPFIPPQTINQVAQLLQPIDRQMATLCTPLISEEQIADPNLVKVVKTHGQQAIYFSRSVIPFHRDPNESIAEHRYYRHLGIYAYRAGFLGQFAQWQPSSLEQMEKLEQLRVLENGEKIFIDVIEQAPPHGVDTKADLEKAIQWAQQLEN